MGTIPKSIEELKKLTLEKDANFSTLANYFFDIMEESGFLKKGEPHKDKKFFKILLKPVTQYFGVNVKAMRLIRIKEFGFIHGSAILSNGITAPLYFFEDENIGLAIACFNAHNEFFRITANIVPLHQVPMHPVTSTIQ